MERMRNSEGGYKYVNLDDCWMQKRDGDGRIVPFADKFPSGMKALADYVHSKGLLFGVDTGNHTCEGYPGSWGYEELDARTYAEWGVDYLKYDYCGMEKTTVSVQASYEKMRDALNASGRPILYSLCSWGSGQPWQWGKQVGNSWRVGIDLFAVWDDSQARSLMLPSFLQPVMGALHAVEQLSQHAGPGGFNDPDMLVVGLEGMYPYGVVQQCPPHIKGCKPGDYISKERWGRSG
ncbi:melibiase [Haematococcus lacustris]|uniref:Alpha-galactosidase n=1 Tax=Haematococcus lacustris TaxID=44745 RepID=A0A699Z3G4_HAELA|nr:melibiase [Haematococcus lacustris]